VPLLFPLLELAYEAFPSTFLRGQQRSRDDPPSSRYVPSLSRIPILDGHFPFFPGLSRSANVFPLFESSWASSLYPVTVTLPEIWER